MSEELSWFCRWCLLSALAVLSGCLQHLEEVLGACNPGVIMSDTDFVGQDATSLPVIV